MRKYTDEKFKEFIVENDKIPLSFFSYRSDDYDSFEIMVDKTKFRIFVSTSGNDVVYSINDKTNDHEWGWIRKGRLEDWQFDIDDRVVAILFEAFDQLFYKLSEGTHKLADKHENYINNIFEKLAKERLEARDYSISTASKVSDIGAIIKNMEIEIINLQTEVNILKAGRVEVPIEVQLKA